MAVTSSYGWQTEYSDIDNIHRQDLLDFYHRYYFPANITLEVYGDFSAAEMKDKLERLFGEWKYTQPPVPAFPKVIEKPAAGVYLASKDDTTQTFFQVGHLGGVLSDKDYPALEVAARNSGRWILQPSVPQRSDGAWLGVQHFVFVECQLRSSWDVRDFGQHAVGAYRRHAESGW